MVKIKKGSPEHKGAVNVVDRGIVSGYLPHCTETIPPEILRISVPPLHKGEMSIRILFIFFHKSVFLMLRDKLVTHCDNIVN